MFREQIIKRKESMGGQVFFFSSFLVGTERGRGGGEENDGGRVGQGGGGDFMLSIHTVLVYVCAYALFCAVI